MSNQYTRPHPPVKDVGIAYILWFFVGIPGGHRFYLRRYCTAVLYLLTAGLFGIGWIIDLFILPAVTRNANAKIQAQGY